MAEQERRLADGEVGMRQLAPTLHHDLTLIAGQSGAIDEFRAVGSEVLLLGGGRSRPYLKRALDEVARVLPRARRVEMPRLDHGATGNADQRGRPALVAAELHRFFG